MMYTNITMSSERLETDLFDTLDRLARPNRIAQTHQRAVELQTLLDEFNGTPAERAELAGSIVDDLDRIGGHVNHSIVINGHVLEGHYDLNEIDFDEEVASNTRAREYDAQELHAISRGYCVVQQRNPHTNESRTVISHMAQTPISQVTAVHGAGHIYKDTYLYIPVDGTAEVRDLVADDTIHMPLVEYYLKDIMQDVDIAVLNGTTPTEILRELSKVNLSRIPGAADYRQLQEELIEEVYEELFKYIDHITHFNMIATHHLTGVHELIIENDETDQHLFVDDAFYGVGDVEGLCFYPSRDEALEFCLVMQLHFRDHTIRRAYIPLNSQIELVELSTPDITH